MIYWKYIINRLFIGVVLIVVFHVLHEATHYTIFQSFGCDNITFGISWSGAYVKATMGDCIYPEFMLLAQSINEIVGYCLMPFVLLNAFHQYDNVMTKTELLDDEM